MNRVLLLAMVTGCIDALAPDVGPAAPPSSCPGDSDLARSVSYRDEIQNGVFDANGCQRCHTGDGIGVSQSGLDLRSYATLRAGGGRSGGQAVVDGDPCSSILVQKLETGPPFGRRMPYDGPPYLTDAELTLVRDWIVEGASDN